MSRLFSQVLAMEVSEAVRAACEHYRVRRPPRISRHLLRLSVARSPKHLFASVTLNR